LDKRQGNLGPKENGQHRRRNRAGAITMEAAVEELTHAARPLPERAGRLAQHNKDASRAVR